MYLQYGSFHYTKLAANLNHMDSRREIIHAGFASLLLAAVGFSERAGGAETKTIYRRHLPPVTLDGWEVTVLDLPFPPRHFSPSTSIQASFWVTSSRENYAFRSKANRSECYRLVRSSSNRRVLSS
jgi:hypothetical protein